MTFAGNGHSVFGHDADPLTGDWGESPRARILRESQDPVSAVNSRRQKGRKRYFNEPDHPGTAAFNLETGFSELPRARRRGKSTGRRLNAQPPINHVVSDIIVEAANWTSEEHHDRMMYEFEAIEQASRSNTPTEFSYRSDSNINFSSPNSLIQDPSCACTMAYPHATSHSHQCVHSIPPQAPVDQPIRSTSDLRRWAQVTTNDYTRSRPSVLFHPSNLTTFPDLPAVARPEPHPITEQQLIDEVKDIYSGLIMLEKDCRDIVAQKSQSSEKFENQEWKELVALHRTLLQEHHDFFSASQHPTASDALKRLAVKYAMPARMWNFGIQPALQLFRSLPIEADRSTAAYVELVYTTLESLQASFPQDAHEWSLVKYNLCEYFIALRRDGVDIPSSFIDRWESGYTSSDWQRREVYNPVSGRFFGDDESIYWFVEENYLESNITPHTSGSIEPGEAFHFQDTALRLMSGWLHYGRRIAISFHAFANAFIFLGLVGRAMPLLNQQTSTTVRTL